MCPPQSGCGATGATSRSAPRRAGKGCHSNPEGRGWPWFAHSGDLRRPATVRNQNGGAVYACLTLSCDDPRGRNSPSVRPHRVIDMEFIVLVIGFIALLTAMAARKQGTALQLQLNGVLSRLGRLQDELEGLRRAAPQTPVGNAAAPAGEEPKTPEVADTGSPTPALEAPVEPSAPALV